MNQIVPLSLLLKADGKQAIAEMRTVSTEAKGTTAALTGIGTAPVDNVVVPLRQVAAATELAGASSRAAAAHTANLTFQFNDIAMMMAAGQNPFMLMMQQGTQVNQVFDGMRASGLSLGTAIRSSLVGMVSPTNLVTMAVIGLGAAAVQYFTAADEKAKTLDDSMGDLEKASRSLSAAISEAKRSIWDLRGEFGDGATAAREMNLALLELARIEGLDKLASSSALIQEKMSGLIDQVEIYEKSLLRIPTSIAEQNAQLGISASVVRNLKETYGLSADEAIRAANAVRLMGDRTNIDGVIEGARQLNQVLMQAKDESGNIPPELHATAQAAAEAVIHALRLQGNTKAIEEVTKALAGVDLGKPFRDANAAAATLAGTVSSLNLSNIGKAAQLAALQGGGSESAAEVAGKIAQKRAELADALASGDPEARELLSSFEAGLNAEASYSDQIAAIIKARADATRSAASAARAEDKASAKEAEAVRDFIASKKTELAVLRETDPVQKEMLRNRELLAAATAKQKEEAEGYIRATLAEQDALNELQKTNEEVKSSFQSGFTSLITGADSFSDALGRVASRLEDMAANSLFDSIWAAGAGDAMQGLTSWLIPGKADGGQVLGAGGPREDNLLHWLSNGEFVVNAAATGENLALLEAINAGADRRQILTMILGGRAPALADGGRVGSVSFAPAPAIFGGASGGMGGAGGRQPLAITANINVTGAQGDKQILAMVQAGMSEAISQGMEYFDREVLPMRISEVVSDPRRQG